MKALLLLTPLVASASISPIKPNLVFQEKNGRVTIEAEHFQKQDHTSLRAWHITTSNFTPKDASDPDPSHLTGASGGAYLEILPDTRRNSQDPLIPGTNYSPTGGKIGVLSYRVQFTQAGRYYCWTRAFTTNSDDNSLHLGINGRWPASSKSIDWLHPAGWAWSCTQRMRDGSRRFGTPSIVVEKPGIHTIQISMREDGAELDKFTLTLEKPKVKQPPTLPALEPLASIRKLPAVQPIPKKITPAKPHISIPVIQCDSHTREDDGSFITLANDFPSGKIYHLEHAQYLALDTSVTRSADTSVNFPYSTRRYNITLSALPERDCAAKHEIKINGKTALTLNVPKVASSTPRKIQQKTTQKIRIRKGDTITVRTKILDDTGRDQLSGRWELLRFSR